MIVSNAIFPELFEIYLEYKNLAGPVDLRFAKRNRRKIKILIDTLTEQSIENILKVKPKNPLQGRSIINSRIDSVSESRDVEYLRALSDVLRHYDGIASKAYIDSTPAIDELLKISLSNLCKHICSRREYIDDANAKMLKSLLRGI